MPDVLRRRWIHRIHDDGWQRVRAAGFPLLVAAVLAFLAVDGDPAFRWRVVGACGAGVVFGLLAWRLRFLAPSGAVAGGLLAATLVGAGGLAWAVPAFTFFLLSSLLSRLGRRRKQPLEARQEKGSVRDAGQVYANGGVGWVLLLLYTLWPSEVLYGGFLGAFAAAAADTWATELGTLAPGLPRLIPSGRRVPPGTSGAVSGLGTLGALAGAAAVWMSALPFVSGLFPAVIGPGGAVAIILGGLLASFVDSLLGATLQARYRDEASGEETERPGSPGAAHRLVLGRRWMNNDRVNLICTLTGALFAMTCLALVAGR